VPEAMAQRPTLAAATWSGRLAAEAIGVLLVVAFSGWLLYGNALSSHKHVAVLRVVTALLPPHMDERGQGREADIIRTALPDQTIAFHLQPFGRHWSAFLSDERFDAVTTVPDAVNDKLKGYRSQTYIRFQNGIGYRRDRFPGTSTELGLGDLAGRRVVAFAGAAKILPGLSGHIKDYPLYLEEKDKRVHSALLIGDEVDAVVADGAIFFEYNKRLGAKRSIDTKFVALACATPYHMVFRSADVRDAFNRGLLAHSSDIRLIEERFLAAERRRERGYYVKSCDQ
jgi:polar amino acid transport system substrate-binding protein